MNILSSIMNRFSAKPSARQQREQLEEEIKLAKLKRKAKIMETGSQDFWMSSYSDLIGRYSDGYINQYPMTQPADRRYGSNFPFWVNEAQLSMLRAQARFVVTTSPNAQGLLNGICSYVIGCGYTYRAAAKKDVDVPENLIKAVQTVINTFTEQNAWAEMEQEIFWRSREDGEAFIRLFPQPDGTLSIRTVEPEQVYQPTGSNILEWSYGIQTELDDVFKIKAYHVDYQAPGGQATMEPIEGEIVDADNMVHIKINVKRSIKRGLSDFAFETLECFQQAGKLRKNMGEGAAVQAAIAAVRQHDTASAGQVSEFIDSAIDYSTTAFGTGRQQDFQKLEAGSFLDIPKGMNYVAPPAAMNSSSHMDIMQGLLRSAGNRHNAPEWLVSSDSSNNNFASSLTAEAPFTRHCVRMQEVYKNHFTRIIKASIKTAIGAGILPKETLNIIDIDVKAPNVETHDKSVEAGNNSIYSSLGIKSKQTIAQEIGLDWEKEERNMEELAGKGIGLPLALPDMGMGKAPPPPAPVPPTQESIESISKKKIIESDDSFSPPESVQKAAQRGLELRKKHNRGGTGVGVARARDLSNGKGISADTIGRMVSYFARHEVDKDGKGWGEDSAGYIAWLLWGGDAGKSWANKIYKKLNSQKTEEGEGLWANINAKKKRGEKPAKKGDEDYPDEDSWDKARKS